LLSSCSPQTIPYQGPCPSNASVSCGRRSITPQLPERFRGGRQLYTELDSNVSLAPIAAKISKRLKCNRRLSKSARMSRHQGAPYRPSPLRTTAPHYITALEADLRAATCTGGASLRRPHRTGNPSCRYPRCRPFQPPTIAAGRGRRTYPKQNILPHGTAQTNVGISCGRVRRPGGPARRVLRRRRDGSGRQLHAELGDYGMPREMGSTKDQLPLLHDTLADRRKPPRGVP
jgi:hypothetical protein